MGLSGIFAGLAVASVLSALVGTRWMLVFLRAEAPQAIDPAQRLEEAAFLVDGTRESNRPAMQELIDTMIALEHVDLHRTRPDAVGFFAGDRELGHIHPSGHLDLPLPRDLGDALVEQGMVEHHRFTESGWYTHVLETEHDARDARWLLQLAHALYELAERGGEDPLTQSELEGLGLQSDLQCHVDACARRFQREGARP